ncbi:MAG: hypothetical protein ACRYFX_09185 [Janthinobacterium lividum]
MKRFLPALLASAALTLSLAACNDASPNGNSVSTPDDVATVTLPDMPPPVDTTGGKKAPAPAANSPARELNAQNATEDIKKMQPQF